MTTTAQDLRSALAEGLSSAVSNGHPDASERFYRLIFSFPTMEAMHRAQDAYVRAVAAPATDEPVAKVMLSLVQARTIVDAIVEHCRGADFSCDMKAATKEVMRLVNVDMRLCRHQAIAGLSQPQRPDLRAWQDAQSEYFDDTIIGIVTEYAEWRDAHPPAAEPVDRKRRMDALWKVLREYQLEDGQTVAEIIKSGHDRISILALLVDALASAEPVGMREAELIEAMRLVEYDMLHRGGHGEDGFVAERKEVALLIVALRQALATPARTDDAGVEIERLKLDLASQECLQDSAYKAGLAAGWNFAQDDDNEGFQRARASTEHVAELKRIRAARSSLSPAPDRGEVYRTISKGSSGE